MMINAFSFSSEKGFEAETNDSTSAPEIQRRGAGPPDPVPEAHGPVQLAPAAAAPERRRQPRWRRRRRRGRREEIRPRLHGHESQLPAVHQAHESSAKGKHQNAQRVYT